MPMSDNGLAKLVEEAGEVLEVAGKMLQYKSLQLDNTTLHPSGYNLRKKLTEEIGDLTAAVEYVIGRLGLDRKVILQRFNTKLVLFSTSYESDEDPPVKPNGYAYGKMLKQLNSMRCTTCRGIGTIDDAELGDISFNVTKCPHCHGAGITP